MLNLLVQRFSWFRYGLVLGVLGLGVQLIQAQNTPTSRYDTVAEMLAARVPASANTRISALVTGRLTANDGGGGTFFYDPSSSASTNLGTIFKPNDSGGRWIREYDGGLNLSWFGAVGNGVADDTSSIANAIAVSTPGTSIISYPNRTYLTTSTLTSTNNFISIALNGSTITPQGNNLTAFRFGFLRSTLGVDGGQSALGISISSNSPSFTYSGASNLRVGDMVQLVSQSFYKVSGYYQGVFGFIASISGTTVTLDRNPDFTLTADSLLIYTAPKGCSFSNAKIDLSNCTGCTGVAIFGENSRVANTQINGLTGVNDTSLFGIYTFGQNIHVTGNTVQNIFESQTSSGRSGYGIFASGVDVLIENNNISNCKHLIASSQRRSMSRNLVYRNNYGYNNPAWATNTITGGARLIQYALDFHANVWNGTMEQNQIFTPRGVFLVRNGNAIIQDNYAVHNDSGSGDGRVMLGVAETAITNLVVSNNQFFSDPGNTFSTFDSSHDLADSPHQNMLFQGNTFNCDLLRFTGTYTPSGGGDGAHDFRHVVISKNIFKSGQTSILLNNKVSNFTISDNIIEYGTTGGGDGIYNGATNITSPVFITGNLFINGANADKDFQNQGSGNIAYTGNSFSSAGISDESYEYRYAPYGNTQSGSDIVQYGTLYFDGSLWYYPQTAILDVPKQGVFGRSEKVRNRASFLGYMDGWVNKRDANTAGAYRGDWATGISINQGDQYRFTANANKIMVALNGGTTGGAEPTVPSTLYDKVNDNGVMWKYIAQNPVDWAEVSSQLSIRSAAGTYPQVNPVSRTETYYTLSGGWWIPYPLNITNSSWKPNFSYSVGNTVHPTVANGLYYTVVNAAGSSGGTEPTWTTNISSTVVDGGITWRADPHWFRGSLPNLGTSNQVLTVNSSGNSLTYTSLPINIGAACSDETTPITSGNGKVTFRSPSAFTLTGVRASLTTAQSSGSIFTVNIKQNGVSVLSTKITIDNGATTSTTATTPPVISTSAITDDAQITVDVDQVGNGTAAGLKVWLIGTR